jgi:hypothetical protein
MEAHIHLPLLVLISTSNVLILLLKLQKKRIDVIDGGKLFGEIFFLLYPLYCASLNGISLVESEAGNNKYQK